MRLTFQATPGFLSPDAHFPSILGYGGSCCRIAAVGHRWSPMERRYFFFAVLLALFTLATAATAVVVDAVRSV